MNLEKTLYKFKILEDRGEIGVLRRSFNFTDEPKFWMYSCASKEGKYESSSLDEDKQSAKVKALGEYLERYCLDNPQQDFHFRTYNEISEQAVNPKDFINFRNSDLGFRKKDYIEKVKNSKLGWVKGKNEGNGSEILIPAQLVYVDYDIGEELMIRPRISTGAAAHESFAQSLHSGILENIERDSYMISFLSKKHIPKINLKSQFSKELEYFKRYLLDLNIFETTTELEIPSFMCLNIDRTGLGPAVSIGLKSDLDPMKAIIGSINESQQVRQWIRNLWIQKNGPRISKPEEIKGIEDRGFYWYDLERLNDLDYLLNSSDVKEFQDIQIQVREKKDLIPHLKGKGIDTYSVDLTTPLFREYGFSVVRAVQSELHPLFLDESFPCYWSRRLEKELNGREINKIPHPFM